jgi:hypothetical protein
MTDYIIAQIVWCILFLLTGLFLVWRYHMKLSRPVAIRAFRQRLFALRDKVIFLVAEGQFREDDPDWQKLYRTLNHSAKATSVVQMKNGLSFVWRLLRLVKPPSEKDLQRVEILPKPLLELWAEYIVTVFSIVWEGSFWVRLVVRLAHHSGMVKRWLEQHRPKETASYRGWQSSAESFRDFQHTPPNAPTPVGSC